MAAEGERRGCGEKAKAWRKLEELDRMFEVKPFCKRDRQAPHV